MLIIVNVVFVEVRAMMTRVIILLLLQRSVIHDRLIYLHNRVHNSSCAGDFKSLTRPEDKKPSQICQLAYDGVLADNWCCDK